jgi:hypothetical protein
LEPLKETTVVDDIKGQVGPELDQAKDWPQLRVDQAKSTRQNAIDDANEQLKKGTGESEDMGRGLLDKAKDKVGS